MYKKYWVVDSDQSICESIGQVSFNTPIEFMPSPYGVVQVEGVLCLIDTTESPTEHPTEVLRYVNQALDVIEVPSTNFTGTRPTRPR